MIVTLTANPAIDRTIELTGALRRGDVQRAARSDVQAGGKGVNVSRALAASGVETLAVFPAAADDAFTRLVAASGLPHLADPETGTVRTNIAVTEPDGTTTKLNEPGPRLDEAELDALGAAVVAACRGAAWLVIAGSLPAGLPANTYTTLVSRVRSELGAAAPRIAVDSSGAPLRHLVHGDEPIDLIKPNAEELAELAGHGDPEALEASPELAARIATESLGAARAALVTLGATGALLVESGGARFAASPRIRAVSTVGAGDSSLAGFLLASAEGQGTDGALAQAVAQGAAAAALPGSTLPARADTRPENITITDVSTRTR